MPITVTSASSTVEMRGRAAHPYSTAHRALNSANGTVAQPTDHPLIDPAERFVTTAEITASAQSENMWDVTAVQGCT